MLLRAGQDVLQSARGPRGGDGQQSSAGVDGARRKVAINKAFKHLDPFGSGFVSLEDIRQALSAAPFAPAAQQKVLEELSKYAEKMGGKDMVSCASFCQYYQAVSPAVQYDGEFEQLLHAQWGFSDVSDILASMQKQFALVGFAYTFKESHAGDLSSSAFEAALKRVGLNPRSDDLLRVCRAFCNQSGSIRLDDFKDQLMSPRPDAPVATRDLTQPTVLPQMPAGRSSRPTSGRPRSTGRIVSARAHQAFPGAPASSPPLRGPSATVGGSIPSDAELDAMLSKMESHLSHLKQKRVVEAGPFTGASSVGRPWQSASRMGEEMVGPEDLDAMLSKMESHLTHLKRKKVGSAQQAGPLFALPDGPIAVASRGVLPEGPVIDADLDAALSNMENRINKIKAHKKVENATPHWKPDEQPFVPLDMPQWEHHKYGHHKITEAAWKPDAQVTDMFGQQHSSAEYGYSVSGAGSHGHHVSHYHLNDYHGLAHHDFKKQEYNRQQHGNAAHHGHWVPHLHGIGTSTHHGEHSYKKEEYGGHSYGKEEHSHWVPHLHGIGQ